MNNTVNTLVMQGLVEGGYYEDCLLLFVSLVVNVRFDLGQGLSPSHKDSLDWNTILKHATCGFGIDDKIATYFDSDTKRRLFRLSNTETSSSKDIEADEEIHIKFHKTNIIGQYITLNKRSYEHCIKAACQLQCIEYADLLYSILVSNRIKPRKNSLFSILNVLLLLLLYA